MSRRGSDSAIRRLIHRRTVHGRRTATLGPSFSSATGRSGRPSEPSERLRAPVWAKKVSRMNDQERLVTEPHRGLRVAVCDGSGSCSDGSAARLPTLSSGGSPLRLISLKCALTVYRSRVENHDIFILDGGLRASIDVIEA